MWSSGRLTVHLCIKLMLTAKFNTVFISASSIKTNLNDFDFGYIIIFQMSHTNHEYQKLSQTGSCLQNPTFMGVACTNGQLPPRGSHLSAVS